MIWSPCSLIERFGFKFEPENTTTLKDLVFIVRLDLT